jgi:hypothetical protein
MALPRYTDVPRQSLSSTPLVRVMHSWRDISQQMPMPHHLQIGLPWPCGGARQQFNTRARCSLGWMTAFPCTSLQRIPVSRLASRLHRDATLGDCSKRRPTAAQRSSSMASRRSARRWPSVNFSTTDRRTLAASPVRPLASSRRRRSAAARSSRARASRVARDRQGGAQMPFGSRWLAPSLQQQRGGQAVDLRCNA